MNQERADRIAADWAPFADIFNALGDAHRQRMLLVFDPDEELPIGAVASAVDLSPTAAAHHIQVLRKAGVFRERREGRTTLLSIDRARLAECLEVTLAYVRDAEG